MGWKFRHPCADGFGIAGPGALRQSSVEMFASTPSRERLFWTLQIGGWIALIPIFTAAGMLAYDVYGAVFNAVFRQAVGFGLTLGLARIYRRWAWTDFSLRRHGTQIVALSLAATAADLLIMETLRWAVQAIAGLVPPSRIHIAAGIGRFCLYAAWSALYLSLRFFFELRDRDLRLAQAQLAARDAELQVLRAQLNPHFLFNALNSILAEADDNPARVKAITLNLSELLRFSLRQQEHFGPLGAEVDAVENYLKVERSRFEERLDWKIELGAGARDAQVPNSLLLPLVENAIKYGLQTSPHPLRVHVSASMQQGVLAAAVENSGRWVQPDPTATRSTGIGLSNLRRRLALLCGPEARVDITFPKGGVRVALLLPVAAHRA